MSSTRGGLHSGQLRGGKAAVALSDSHEVASLVTFCLIQTAVTVCNQNHNLSAIVYLFFTVIWLPYKRFKDWEKVQITGACLFVFNKV